MITPLFFGYAQIRQHHSLPTENLVTKCLDTSTSLYLDDRNDDKTPKHHEKSPETVAIVSAARSENRIVVVAEDCKADGDPAGCMWLR